MFTGLIEEVGSVASILTSGPGKRLQIGANRISSEVRQGDSIAVNGCCLTISAHDGEQLTFDLLQETLARTNLRALGQGSAVNLERALAANSRLGGHFVQGHVDCTAPVLSFSEIGAEHRLELEL